MIRNWQDIPGFFDFMDIYNQAVDEAQDGDMLVEVGTFLGKSAAYMVDRIKASRKNLLLYTVDNWAHPLYARWWENVRNPAPEPWPVPELVGKSLPDAFKYCVKVTKSDELIGAFRLESIVAAERFQDRSVFFVFLDADHEYEGIRDDIAAWRGKVKPGGILAGHDYKRPEWPGVERAVHEAFPMDRIEHRHNSWLVRM